jgi:hypothetical protein
MKRRCRQGRKTLARMIARRGFFKSAGCVGLASGVPQDFGTLARSDPEKDQRLAATALRVSAG